MARARVDSLVTDCEGLLNATFSSTLDSSAEAGADAAC